MVVHDGEGSSRRQFLRTSAGLGSLVLAGTGGWGAAALAQAQAGAQPLPERFDINDLMGPVKDQGERQTCVAFAVIAAAEAAFARDTGQRLVLSEEYLLYKINGGAPRPADESGLIVDHLNKAIEHGFALAEDWPYQPRICPPGSRDQGCPVEPDDMAAIDLKADKLRHKDWSDISLSVNWRSSLAAERKCRFIAERIWRAKGAPIFALPLPDEHRYWPDDGRLAFPEYLRGSTEEQLESVFRHFAVLTGFDLARREFYFKNSWGRSWGRDGYGTIPFDLAGSPLLDPVMIARKPKV